MSKYERKIFSLTEILEAQDVLHVLRQIVWLLGIGITISGGLYFFTQDAAWGRFLRNSVVGLGIGLILIQLAKQNKTQLAAYFTLFFFGIWLLSVAWDGAGVSGITYTLLVLIVIGSGLFIGRQAGYVTALLISMAGVGLIFAARAGLLIHKDRPISDLSAWLLTTITFFIAAHMVGISIVQINRALTQARNEVADRIAAETEIRRLNAELEQRIAERTRELLASREQYRQRANEMSMLYRLGNIFTSSQDLADTLQSLWSEINQLIPADAFYVAFHDAQTDLVSYPIFFYKGVTTMTNSASRLLKENPGLTGAVVYNKATLYLPDMFSEAVVKTYAPVDDNDYDLSTFLGVPLISKERVIGMLSVQTRQKNAYSPEQVQLVESIAAQAALAIDKAYLFDQLQHELKEKEKLILELENINTELERFTYTVSHDLRAPLVTVRGFLGYLERDIKTGNEQRIQSDMERIVRSTDSMNLFLERLLSLSRAGHIIDNPQTVSLEKVTRNVIDLLEMQIKEKQIHIQIANGLPEIQGDPIRLTQVLQNLIENAIKFTGNQPNPQIEIAQRGETANGDLIICVSDNGKGIAHEHINRIFVLFDKLDSASEGTGIGLATVKRIIETHKGRIWVESEGLGKGSTFCFTIPDNRKH